MQKFINDIVRFWELENMNIPVLPLEMNEIDGAPHQESMNVYKDWNLG
jgi:hypothetical protein